MFSLKQWWPKMILAIMLRPFWFFCFLQSKTFKLFDFPIFLFWVCTRSRLFHAQWNRYLHLYYLMTCIINLKLKNQFAKLLNKFGQWLLKCLYGQEWKNGPLIVVILDLLIIFLLELIMMNEKFYFDAPWLYDFY